MSFLTSPENPFASLFNFDFANFFACCFTTSPADAVFFDAPDRPQTPVDTGQSNVNAEAGDSGVGGSTDQDASVKQKDEGVRFLEGGRNPGDTEDELDGKEEGAEGEHEGEEGEGEENNSAEQEENEFGTQGALVPFGSNRQLAKAEDTNSVDSGPSSQEQVVMANCELEMEFDARKGEVNVIVVKMTNFKQQILDSVKLEHRDLIKLRLSLLPSNSKRSSEARSISSEVIFGDRFTFTDIMPNDLSLLGLRIRAYRCRRHRRSIMIGETTLPFFAVKFSGKVTIDVALDARITLEELDTMSHSSSSRTTRAVRSFAENVFDTLESGIAALPLAGAQAQGRSLSGGSNAALARSSSRSLPSNTGTLSELESYEHEHDHDPETISNGEGSRALALTRRRSVASSSGSSFLASSTLSSTLGRKRRAAELQLGLAYILRTGRLNITVLKAANLTASEILTRSRMRELAKLKRQGRLDEALERDAPDTLVEVQLSTPEGTLATSRTTVRKRETDPTFQEEFVYDVPMRALDHLTATLTIYNQRKGLPAVLGWIAFGKQNSGVDEATHWLDMRANLGQNVVRWHTLLK